MFRQQYPQQQTPQFLFQDLQHQIQTTLNHLTQNLHQRTTTLEFTMNRFLDFLNKRIYTLEQQHQQHQEQQKRSTDVQLALEKDINIIFERIANLEANTLHHTKQNFELMEKITDILKLVVDQQQQPQEKPQEQYQQPEEQQQAQEQQEEDHQMIIDVNQQDDEKPQEPEQQTEEEEEDTKNEEPNQVVQAHQEMDARYIRKHEYIEIKFNQTQHQLPFASSSSFSSRSTAAASTKFLSNSLEFALYFVLNKTRRAMSLKELVEYLMENALLVKNETDPMYTYQHTVY